VGRQSARWARATLAVLSAPAVRDLVLIGGGHSHLAVLKRFGMRPVPGVRLTLISRSSRSPYSGMLPGLIAGHYTEPEMHFDLRALARFSGARFIAAEVTGLDLAAQRILLADRAPLGFDLLSINAGITPALTDLLVAGGAVTPVKPIDAFQARWIALQEKVLAASRPLRLAVVGGGAGGVELALAVSHRLTQDFEARGRPRHFELSLFSASASLLPTHAAQAARYLAQALAAQNIRVHLNTRIVKALPATLEAADGRQFPIDETLWVTHAAPAPWLAASGLAVDDAGFVSVNAYLQSASYPAVFAAGDCAGMVGAPRPKSGVYAVRQGTALAENLQRACRAQALRAFKPQASALAIIGTGPRHAVATRGRWAVKGAWVWRWKDFIDRRFMRKFQHLPSVSMSAPAAVVNEEALDALGPLAMRCGGCGSKVGAEILTSAIRDLQPQAARPDILLGLAARDDAALTVVPPGRAAVHTIDGFRSFLSDPYLFGQITAAHAVSDLFAMGATPQSALAYVTLPLAAPALMQRDLTQLLAGAIATLNAAGALLVGGHTSEGAEFALALAVNGHIEPGQVRAKDSPQAGDVLVLTKALGTGIVMAAEMRGLARSEWLEACVAQMLTTNATAAAELARFEVHALTDVTGFGLAGHLAEMLRRGGLQAQLRLSDLPVLPGACELSAQGVRSSLHRQNERLIPAITIADSDTSPERCALLFDPQTSGGLLLALPAAQAPACVAALRAVGYPASAIGHLWAT